VRSASCLGLWRCTLVPVCCCQQYVASPYRTPTSTIGSVRSCSLERGYVLGYPAASCQRSKPQCAVLVRHLCFFQRGKEPSTGGCHCVRRRSIRAKAKDNTSLSRVAYLERRNRMTSFRSNYLDWSIQKTTYIYDRTSREKLEEGKTAAFWASTLEIFLCIHNRTFWSTDIKNTLSVKLTIHSPYYPSYDPSYDPPYPPPQNDSPVPLAIRLTTRLMAPPTTVEARFSAEGSTNRPTDTEGSTDSPITNETDALTCVLTCFFRDFQQPDVLHGTSPRNPFNTPILQSRLAKIKAYSSKAGKVDLPNKVAKVEFGHVCRHLFRLFKELLVSLSRIYHLPHNTKVFVTYH
jgi:hypothetical protein